MNEETKKKADKCLEEEWDGLVDLEGRVLYDDKTAYNIFICGYEQAEKDLALTWEDAQLLHIITEKYMRELDNRIEAYPSSSQELFEEVLRRFNEQKK